MKTVCQILWVIWWQTKWQRECTCRSTSCQTLVFLRGDWDKLCAWWSCRSSGCACVLRPKLKVVHWCLQVLLILEWLPNVWDQRDRWIPWLINQQIDKRWAVREPNVSAWHHPSSWQEKQLDGAFDLATRGEDCEHDHSCVWWLHKQPCSASYPCQRTPSETRILPLLKTSSSRGLLSWFLHQGRR